MRWLLFLARIAFICNVFFVISLVLRMITIELGQGITAFIVVIGMLMAPLLNLVFNLSFVISYYVRKEPLGIPGWIIAVNLIAQVLQLITIPFI